MNMRLRLKKKPEATLIDWRCWSQPIKSQSSAVPFVPELKSIAGQNSFFPTIASPHHDSTSPLCNWQQYLYKTPSGERYKKASISNTPPYLRNPVHLDTMPSWSRLIRFEATDGRILRGEPILPSPDFDVGTTTEQTGLKAKIIQVANNDIFGAETKVTDEEVTVRKLLGPVTIDEVPIIRCIGLNFIKHSTSNHDLHGIL